MRAALLVLLAACARPGEHRAEQELDVGRADMTDASVVVANGLAAVREIRDHGLTLWANAPTLDVELTVGTTAGGDWTIVAHNTLLDNQLVLDGAAPLDRMGGEADLSTTATWTVLLAPGVHTLRIVAPDADTAGPFQVAAMADIQTAMPEVDDVFRAISAVPNLRFVVAMGDITERAQDDEYDLFERQLAYLRVPYFTTLGNHELWAPADHYFERFGRASFHFAFKDVEFTFADSGDADIDPTVDGWIEQWIQDARTKTHVFLTHIPPIDPVGVRYGGFRSTRDGEKLLGQLSDGLVDLTLYGHIHTFIDFENAGIPAFVSGGGGAAPMKGDGIDRHFLVVSFDATKTDSADLYGHQGRPGGVRAVELHCVDDCDRAPTK
ncbi:MAG TPA: metallophosphoesterase [Kofleriaceae bacterium]|jgi:predicted phosphodiesterase